MKFARGTVILIMFLIAVTLPASADTILDIDFEGLTVDEPVGTGGPYAGEPMYVGICTTAVRDTPMPTRCLEISDNVDWGSGYVNFEFLMESEPTSGVVEMSADLWFFEMDSYLLNIREHGSSAQNFCSIRFTDLGALSISDANGGLGSFGSFTTGQLYTIQFLFDMDTGTYDIVWDDSLIVDDRAHGISDRGIGRMSFGFDHDTNLDGMFYIDSIVVSAPSITPVSAMSWGSLKGIYR